MTTLVNHNKFFKNSEAYASEFFKERFLDTTYTGQSHYSVLSAVKGLKHHCKTGVKHWYQPWCFCDDDHYMKKTLLAHLPSAADALNDRILNVNFERWGGISF